MLAERSLRQDNRARGWRLFGRASDSREPVDDLVEKGEAVLDVADVLSHMGRQRPLRELALEGIELLQRKRARLLVENARERFAELFEADGGGAASPGPDIRP